MLFDHNNQPIEGALIDNKPDDDDVKHIPSANFPPPTPKPEWFDNELLKIGGYVAGGNKIPKYRVVWGMTEKQYAMGGMHLKYISIIDTIQTTKGYNVINTKTGKKKFLHAGAAIHEYGENFDQNVKPGELLAPVITEEIREIGLPLWVAEYFMEPEGFGSKREWDNNRWMTNPENAKHYIDVLGPYPSQGAYLEWFQLFDYDEEGRIAYKPLDEGALELFRANHAFNEARRKALPFNTTANRKKSRDAAFEEEWAKYDNDIVHGIEDVKKNKRFNITPKG